MSILNFNSTQKTNERDGKEAQQKASQLWLNPGFTVGEDTFVSLPYGIAIDTMNTRQIRGGNTEFNKQIQAGNDFLQDLIKAGFDRLQPGAYLNLLEFLPTMELRLQRANVAVDVAPADNEFSIDTSKLFG